MSKLPPIKLRRLYTNPEKTGMFVLQAEPLPQDVWDKMSERERIARMEAENKAINAEWARIRSEN
jgi:hypothetical protein